MKARLLALAAVLALAGVGAVKFLNWNDATSADAVTGGVGLLEVIDRSKCSVAACNAPTCTQAQGILNDAGTPCTVGFVDCSVRIGAPARAMAADAGFTFGPQIYQRVRLIGMRCAVDGGFAYAVPVTDAGWPIFAVTTTTPLCVRAPLDGGTSCLRKGLQPDGGAAFFGTGNVFPSGQAAGSNCEQVECGVVFGDDPNKTL